MHSSPRSEDRKSPPIRIALVGTGQADDAARMEAEAVGREVAARDAVLICGGRGGVMAAGARGCREAGGLSVGVMPGTDRQQSAPNQWIDLPIYTGAGQGRNLVVVLTAQVVIAVGGGWGTLSEIALARKHGRPVIVLGEWELTSPAVDLAGELERVDSASEAVARAVTLARSGG